MRETRANSELPPQYCEWPTRGRLLAGLALVLLAPQSPAHGQAALHGIVRQDSSRSALGGVEVLVEGTNFRVVTDASGNYQLVDLPVGTHVVLFRLLGYRPVRASVQIQARTTARLDATLVRQGAQVLDSIGVTGRVTRGVGMGREAFEERRSRGFGRFIDTEELRRNEHRRLADMFRGVGGVTMVRFRECLDPPNRRCGPYEQRASGGRGAITSIMPRRGSEYCWMSVMLDGRPLYINGSSMKVPDFSRDILINEIDLVEVYASAAETPGEYSGTAAACGVILLWSRQAP